LVTGKHSLLEEKLIKLQPVRVIVHPGYVRPSKDHDLALLLFDGHQFNITEWVRPICLWDKSYSIEEIRIQTGEVKKNLAKNQSVIKKTKVILKRLTVLQVVGWGFTKNNSQADILRQASISVLPHKDCYLQDRQFYSTRLKPGFNFCIGRKGDFLGDSLGEGLKYLIGRSWRLRR